MYQFTQTLGSGDVFPRFNLRIVCFILFLLALADHNFFDVEIVEVKYIYMIFFVFHIPNSLVY